MNARRTKKREKALKLLGQIPTYNAVKGLCDEEYERRNFGWGWKDFDGDGEDTRAEILIAFHRPGKEKVPLVMDDDGDRVVSGRWLCRWSEEWVTDAGDLDIDHLVPLKEAWVSGACQWDKEKRERYSNGQGIRTLRRGWLVPALSGLNRSKGAKRPDEWMPPNEHHHLWYAAEWIEAKHYWKLSIQATERVALFEALDKL